MASKSCVTVSGLPLTIELAWPFKASSAGADFHVLHGTVRLDTGEGLHAEVSVQVTATVREVLPSLEPGDTEAPVLNTLRKTADIKQLEFLKSSKRLPVQLSSRQYDFKRNRWWFVEADEAQARAFLRRKVFWLGVEKREPRVWLADPVDAQYLGIAPERLVELAGQLDDIRVDGEYGLPTEALAASREQMWAEMRHAAEEVEKKHAYERG